MNGSLNCRKTYLLSQSVQNNREFEQGQNLQEASFMKYGSIIKVSKAKIFSFQKNNISRNPNNNDSFNDISSKSRKNKLKTALTRLNQLNSPLVKFDKRSARIIHEYSQKRRVSSTLTKEIIYLQQCQSEKISTWEREKEKLDHLIFRDGRIKKINGWIEPSSCLNECRRNVVTDAKNDEYFNDFQNDYDDNDLISSVIVFPNVEQQGSCYSTRSVISVEGIRSVASDSKRSIGYFVSKKVDLVDSTLDDGAFSVWSAATTA